MLTKKIRIYKIFASLLCLVLIISACAPAAVTEAPEAAEEAVEEAAPVTEEEAAPEEKEPCLIVGAIYVGSVTDAGYNQSMHDGLLEMHKNIPCIEILEAENVTEGPDAVPVMETMIQQGATLMFPTSFGHMEPAFELAEKYPDVKFEHAGGYLLADNFGTYYAQMQFAMYVVGVAAGAMTETNKLGFVAAMPLGFSLGNVNSFTLGAQSVNPDVETIVVFTGSWVDRAKEAAATNALIDQGVDVVTMHVDSPITVIQTAEERGVYSIGFQSLAAQEFAPEGWITGLGFTYGGFMTETAQKVMDGTWEPAHVRGTMGEGFISLAPFGKAVPEEVQKQVLDAAEALNSGSLQVFAGPIIGQDGTVKIAEGEVWGNEKMGDFDWLVKGVIGETQ